MYSMSNLNTYKCMKKFVIGHVCAVWLTHRKKFGILKCMMLFLLFFSMQAYANNQLQDRMNVRLENSGIKELFNQIEANSSYDFLYNEALISDVYVTIDATNETVEEILKNALMGTGLSYEIDHNTILIKREEKPVQQTQVVTIHVKGQVTGEDDMPIPGVTVVIKGTYSGVYTDADGRYEISGKFAGEPILAFSCIGMISQEIPVNDREEINVVLKEELMEMSEVVVNGVFSRKANTYTGSVTTVKRDELLKMSTQNVLTGLANYDPSFVMTENLTAGSNPNSTPSYQIRGTSAISENLQSEYENDPNQPLFILDGFETTIDKVTDLDVNLIESVTVLKDATAKAVYGSKGANGVVVLQTRRPEEGKLRVMYNGSLSLELPDLTSYDLLNASEKLQVEKMAGLYDSDSYLEKLELGDDYNEKLLEVLRGVNTDWLAQPVRIGIGQKHTVYIDGGNDALLYAIDLSYHNIEGAMKGSDRNTFNGGVTLTYQKKNLLIRNKLSITSNKANESPYGTFSDYAQMNPYSRIYDEDGNMIETYDYDGTDVANPLWNTTINTINSSQYLDVTNNFYGEYKILPHLKAVGRFGITVKKTQADDFKPASHSDFFNVTDVYSKGSYDQTKGNYLSSSGDLGLSYSFQINKHLVFANARVDYASNNYDYSTMSAEGFANDMMNDIIFAVQYADGEKPSGAEGISHSAGGLLSFNYSYDERFLVDANYRQSGSSEYGANNRWGTFWSAGAGWNIHNEQFMKNLSFINQLKLRFSTGYTGSQGFNTYEALSTVNYFSSESYNGNIGSYLVSMANPDLKWQSKYDNSIGVDFGFLDNRVSGKFDYYVSDTKSMLTDVTLPESTGFTYYRANLGETQNKGIEASVNVRLFQQQRNYINVFASMAHNKNVLKKISNSLKAFNDEQDDNKNQSDSEDTYDDITTPSVRYIEGESINTIWAVKSLGIDPTNGKEIFEKADGSVTYDWDSDDYIAAGDEMPSVTGTFGFASEFKSIGCNVSFYYRLGGQIYNSTLVDKVENADLAYNVDKRVMTDRWQEPGDDALYKAITNTSYTRPTTRFVEDYNTLTLSSVNLYYDFRNTPLVKKSFLQQLKLSLNMNDLFVISSVNTERGTDYPFARNASFTLQATF